eukprot:SAG22_NODE_1828_length_3492_cov_69.414677_4_plen_84_part_00
MSVHHTYAFVLRIAPPFFFSDFRLYRSSFRLSSPCARFCFFFAWACCFGSENGCCTGPPSFEGLRFFRMWWSFLVGSSDPAFR